MGHSWSSRRRPHTHARRHHQSHRPPQPPTPRPLPPSYAFAANAPYPAPPQNTNLMMPAPLPYPQNPNFNVHNYPAPMAGQYNYYLNYGNQVFYPPPQPPPPPPPPLYVDHQSAKKVRNSVNVHKDSIRVEADEENPGYHLVSFTFDAIVDGRYRGLLHLNLLLVHWFIDCVLLVRNWSEFWILNMFCWFFA